MQRILKSCGAGLRNQWFPLNRSLSLTVVRVDQRPGVARKVGVGQSNESTNIGLDLENPGSSSDDGLSDSDDNSNASADDTPHPNPGDKRGHKNCYVACVTCANTELSEAVMYAADAVLRTSNQKVHNARAKGKSKRLDVQCFFHAETFEY